VFAGKTTTLKILSGIIKLTSGQARVMGFDPYEKNNAFRKKLAFLMGNKNQAFLNLPAVESFNANRIIYDIDKKVFTSRVKELTEMIGISEKINIPVRQLSFGERMKVEFVLSLLHDPEIVFLDEPTIGMDLVTQYNLRKYIHDYFALRKNVTFIITSHNMIDIEDLCDRIIIIKDGLFVYDGAKKNLRGSDRKIEIFFNAVLDETSKQIIKSFGYEKVNDIHYQKIADFAQFQNDWNNLLVNMNIKDFSFKEIDFDKIIGRYMINEN